MAQTNASFRLAAVKAKDLLPPGFRGEAEKNLAQQRIINHSKICIPLFPVRIEAQSRSPRIFHAQSTFRSFIESVDPHKPYHNVFISIVNIPSIIPFALRQPEARFRTRYGKSFSIAVFLFRKAKREVNISLFSRNINSL